MSVRVGDLNIAQATELSISDALAHFKSLTFGPADEVIAKPIIKEVTDRLTFLNNVGLDYLTLSRVAGSWGSPTYSSGYPNWLQPQWGPLYLG